MILSFLVIFASILFLIFVDKNATTLGETDVIPRGRVTGSNTFVARQPTVAALEMVVQVVVIQSLH